MYKDPIKGFIFDLDGTLVTSELNFTEIKENIGCPLDEDVLEYISQIQDDHRRKAAEMYVVEMELKDALNATWICGAQCFLEQLHAHSIPMAIVTRNCRSATSVKINNNHIPIKLVLTREDAPSKPDPTALQLIAKEWRMEPSDIVYVGDYIYDIQAANRANMRAWSFGFDAQGYPQNKVDKYFDSFTELNINEFVAQK
ncbi:MAG: Phosphoglycolate phosphatase [Glaciecola sp. HTCC2999]|jgi:HAD superfamily hydrolase (TIGR01509 family)|nr:MAG: Phosphoglycolate phosphatase [Glaciecola sp. HTCC2999]